MNTWITPTTIAAMKDWVTPTVVTSMNEWITPAVITAIVTGFFTYLGTKRSSKAELETLYSNSIQKLLDKNEISQAEMKAEIVDLKKQLDKVKENLRAKDELILELRKEINRLELENTTLRGEK